MRSDHGTSKTMFKKPFRASHSLSIVLDPETPGVYRNSSRLSKADHLFDEIPQRDISYYNTLLVNYSRTGQLHEALEAYALINSTGVRVDACSASCMLKVCGSLQNIVFGRLVHCQCIKGGFLEDVITGTSLVDMYIKGRCLVGGHWAASV